MEVAGTVLSIYYGFTYAGAHHQVRLGWYLVAYPHTTGLRSRGTLATPSDSALGGDGGSWQSTSQLNKRMPITRSRTCSQLRAADVRRLVSHNRRRRCRPHGKASKVEGDLTCAAAGHESEMCQRMRFWAVYRVRLERVQ